MSELNGAGFYLRSLSESKHGTPKQAAKKAHEHGVSHVHLLAVWQDFHKERFRHLAGNTRKGKLKRYAEAFAARGIDVWLWGYPWGGAEDRFVESMVRASEDAPIYGWLIDPELGYKWASSRAEGIPETMRGQGEAVNVAPKGTRAQRQGDAARLVRRMKEGVMAEGIAECGVTSYGIPKFHPNFPWKEFAELKGVGSPQLYTSTPRQVDLGMRLWKEMGYSSIAPSVGAYGPRSGSQMRDHMYSFVSAKHAVDAFIIWSWKQMDDREWRTVAEINDMIYRGACEL